MKIKKIKNIKKEVIQLSERIKVEINPLPFYSRYASSDYVLCGLDFYINLNSEEYHFRSQSSNNCLSKLLNEIEDYLAGNLSDNTELVYYIPWIVGECCIYPYSFIIRDSDTWFFRYKRNQNGSNFDFECDLCKGDIIALYKQLKSQFAEVDWPSLGKTELYTFDFPKLEYDWCYSANDFQLALSRLCVGHSINKIFVGATNYAEPLRVDENYVNYYIGSELIIEFDTFLIDFLILAEGLFRWRIFKKGEYSISKPIMKYIEDGDKEFCDIGNVYDMFTLDYASSAIKKVAVDDTDCWPWNSKSFDESKLGNPIELPKAVHFHLDNEHTLSLYGCEDNFAIKIAQL